jgi:hypothetical protein
VRVQSAHRADTDDWHWYVSPTSPPPARVDVEYHTEHKSNRADLARALILVATEDEQCNCRATRDDYITIALVSQGVSDKTTGQCQNHSFVATERDHCASKLAAGQGQTEL